MVTNFSKEHIIDALKDIANLIALSGGNHFKTRAYTKAVDTFKEMNEDFFSRTYNFQGLDGIGESLNDKIIKIRETGTCEKLDELMEEYGERLPLMSIKGIGAKTINKLWDEYLVRSIDDLKRMVADNTITAKAVIKAVKNMRQEKRLPLQEATKIADELCSLIAKLDEKSTFGSIKACGSIRRQKDSVGDLDIIVELTNKTMLESISSRISSMLLDGITAEGKKKISGQYKDIHVDIRFAEPTFYGAMILYFTGPRQFNINMRTKAMKMRLRLNEYGVWLNEERIAGATEKEIFDVLSLDYISPEERK